MNKKLFIIPAISIILLLILVAVLFQISKLRTFQFFGELVARVDTNEKVVALTFDDAPTEYTQEVLRILDAKDVKGTFYVIGSNAEKDSETLKHIVESGHEVGNHSYTHKRFLLKSLDFVKTEIEKTNVLIRNSGYEGEITFRPPNGKKLFTLPWYLNQQKIKTIMWDVEPDTYFSGDLDAIVEYTLENAKPGSIILLHPFCGAECQADRDALPRIIDGLHEKGYRFVTVSELLRF